MICESKSRSLCNSANRENFPVVLVLEELVTQDLNEIIRSRMDHFTSTGKISLLSRQLESWGFSILGQTGRKE